jgi:hypothetical protein
LFVFWLGTRHSRRQEQVRLEWEFMSALQLVYEDLLHHKHALDSYVGNPELVWTFPLPPTTDIWEAQRWRIVLLGHGDFWSDLSPYYGQVRVLKMWKEGPVRAHDPALTSLLAKMQQQNEHILRGIKSALLKGVKAQDRRPWWRRRFGRTRGIPTANSDEPESQDDQT